jgi:hypothetical protein
VEHIDLEDMQVLLCKPDNHTHCVFLLDVQFASVIFRLLRGAKRFLLENGKFEDSAVECSHAFKIILALAIALCLLNICSDKEPLSW